MKILRIFIPAFCAAFLFISCIQEEPKNSECDIVSAWVEGDEYVQYFADPSQMKHENISTGDSEITFITKSFIYSSLPDFPVYFTVTEGAKIEPESGSLQDFKAGPVTYTVTSEDGDWHRTYTVAFQEYSMPSSTFSFEYADTVESTYASGMFYHEFYELDENNNRLSIWASGNPGAILASAGSAPEDQPTYQSSNGYSGKCVCLNTQSAGFFGELMHKPIAAGNLFLGSFIFEAVLTDTLKSTKFGIPFTKTPSRITGWYKYTPGESYTDANSAEVSGKVDEPNIYAVFYRNKDAEGNDVYLYGDDVLTSEYIVRKAEVGTLSATDEWTQFELNFDDGEVDETILANLGYNLTVVFTSSKNGALFEGAVGSTLYIDEVEVIFEEQN